MTTETPAAPRSLSRAPSAEDRRPTQSAPAEPASPAIPFKRVVVFASLRDAVGCTAGA